LPPGGATRRRSWRKLHIGVDAASGEIVAVAVTRKDIDDAVMAGALLDQIADPIASFTADGAYDQDQVTEAVANRHPDAAVVVPPRAGAIASASVETAPTRRDRILQMIAERSRSRTNQQVSADYRRFHFPRPTATVLNVLEAA
jgi:Transposase DDE domain